MIIIRNNWFPFKGYAAINICGILFTKVEPTKRMLNHERIHTKQMLEMLIIGFYLWYVIEYIIVRFAHIKQKDAYHDISFEEEASINENNFNYLKQRKHYAWFKYIKIHSYKVK